MSLLEVKNEKKEMLYKRGLITVATGRWYCYLAQNLVISYRMFANCHYPFYVITDKKGEKQLRKYFDGVIVIDKPHHSFLDKIDVYKYSPFDETIFMDADMNIIKDISFIFDGFEQNGSEVSCFGDYVQINDESKPPHFKDAAINHFGLTRYIDFGGGIYYFKKSKAADSFFECIFKDLIPNYDKYEMKRFYHPFTNEGDMADEPLMGLSMLINGMEPYRGTQHLMRHNKDDMMKTFRWDMKNHECTMYWRGKVVHPYIAHYATYNTWKLRYYIDNTKLRNKYFKIYPPISWLHILIVAIKWVFTPRQIKEFSQWFAAHFTAKYWSYQFGKIKKALVKED